MSALAAIHAKRRQVHSLKEDEAWRDFVEKFTGQRSTRGLSPAQEKALLTALDKMGATKSPRRRQQLSGPYAKKIQALWIGCWNLGLIEKRDDEALNRFAVKQANVDHVNWVRDQEDAVAVVEALKAMMARRGVNWSPPSPLSPAYTRQPGYQIAVAQWLIVKGMPDLNMSLAEYVDTIVGRRFDEMHHSDWIAVMNALGRKVRAQVKSAGR